MKQALLILFSLFLLSISPASAQEECHIDSEVWFTTGYEAQDQHLCTFDWAVVDVQYNPPLEGSGAEGTCQVIVDLVGEDDERLDTLTVREDGNAQLWNAGQWVSMTEFEHMTLQRGCTFSPIS